MDTREYRNFNIYLSGDIIARVQARDATEALDVFSQFRSGYDSFAEMVRSAWFSATYATVYAA